MIIGNYEKFCKDYELCEGYEKAINSSEDYFLHHIQGENISREELKEKDLYYDCEPENLRWVTNSEHTKIHNSCMRFETRKKISESLSGENNPNFGKTFSDETRKKMSDAQKGENNPLFGKKGKNNPNFGKKRSDETKRKISETKKGRPSNTKGMSWKLVDGKRIYSERKL